MRVLHPVPSLVASITEDIRYATRRLLGRPLSSAVAIASLALAMGACIAAFQLAHSLLFRPLPIAGADRLYAISHRSTDANGQPRWIGAYEYPLFVQLRDAARPHAELLAVSPAERVDVTYRSDVEIEKASVQYVSGRLFARFGLRPAAGRLFTDGDDTTPGAHPVALITYDYWTRRFGRDPGVVGHVVRVGNAALTIVGVVEPGFAGTETGSFTDVFVPTMMHPGVGSDDSWTRILVHLSPGKSATHVLQRLTPVFVAFREERARTFRGLSPQLIAQFLRERIEIAAAPSGVSDLQQAYRRPLVVLGLLVMLVLGIACANLANLQAAQTAARQRELAVRAAIGAAPSRLARMIVAESLVVTTVATGVASAFAAWAVRLMVGTLGGATPVHLDLSLDWRVAAFAGLLAVGATALFALAPAWRSASSRPMHLIRAGENARRGWLSHGLIAAQSAFCVIIVVLAALFVATFGRLADQPMGFTSDGVVLVDATSRQPQPLAVWEDAAVSLSAVPGVARVAMAAFPLLSGSATNGFIALNSGAPEPTLSMFLTVSPGWLDAMGVHLIEGRDFEESDTRRGVALVNQAFVNAYFAGRNPIGRTFDRTNVQGRYTIVGIVADARYRDLRGAIQPTAYLPFQSVDANGQPAPLLGATFVVRTALADPAAFSATLRRTLGARQPSLLVTNVGTQRELVYAATRRERVLAALGMFFAAVALLLAGVGLYGVLDDAVIRRRREIGIRLAVGARNADVVRAVTSRTLVTVATGALVGWSTALLLSRSLGTLVYEVHATDPAVGVSPWLALAAIAAVATLRPTLNALRVDPVRTLRE